MTAPGTGESSGVTGWGRRVRGEGQGAHTPAHLLATQPQPPWEPGSSNLIQLSARKLSHASLNVMTSVHCKSNFC